MIDVVIEFADGTYRLPAAEVTVETERESVESAWVNPGVRVPVVTSQTVTVKTDLPWPRLVVPETETFKPRPRARTERRSHTGDPVDAPSHYTRGSIEVKDFIADQGFGFFLGSAVKYISRAGYKGDAVEDLRKAQKMIDFEIELIEKQVAAGRTRGLDPEDVIEDDEWDDEWRPLCDCC